MLRTLPIVLALALCFSNLGFINFGGISGIAPENPPAFTVDAHNPRNHLTQDKNAQAATVDEVYVLNEAAEPPAQNTAEAIAVREENILRLHWFHLLLITFSSNI